MKIIYKYNYTEIRSENDDEATFLDAIYNLYKSLKKEE